MLPQGEVDCDLMRWVRSNVRLGSRLALLALAVQLVVTFGHVHIYGLASASAKAAPSAAASKSNASLPTSPRPAADFDCPICALIQLASTSAPAVAPVLPVLAIFSGFRLEMPGAPEWTSSPYFLFQARAPPSL
jgi:hypothetical protein